jgi:hypothetical protein
MVFPVTATRRRRWPFLLLAVVCLVAATVVAGALWLRDDSGYPDAWDPRVEEYADFAEKERGLNFEHPIHVDFLPEAEFKEQVTSDEEDLTDEEREDIEQSTGVFRALGLIEGEFDLFESVNQLKGSGVVGYYSYEDERIRIRGTELTPSVESTLVHELTHALQDQHFDLGKHHEELEEADDSAASSAYTALVEGDARRIQAAWRENLSEEEQETLWESEAEQGEQVKSDSAGAPEVLETLMAAPYVFGEALLWIAVEEGGDEAVDDLFMSPPTTDEHQLDPWTLIDGEDQPLDVPEPTLAEGEEEFDDGSFGAIWWLLLLSERIPAEKALTAVDGWGGDAYLAFERDGVSCVRIHYEAETGSDLDQMEQALDAWTSRQPDGPASVRLEGSMLVFESCDPGADVDPVATGGSQAAVRLAIGRTYLSGHLIDAGLAQLAARCAADRMVREFTAKELGSSDTDPARVRQVMGPCLA